MASDYSSLGTGTAKHAGLGGRAATTLFAVMLLAFVAESQLAQYVQTNLNYRQPYLLFYIAHSTMSLVLPLHLIYLHITSPLRTKAYLRSLSLAVKGHLSRGIPVTTLENATLPLRRLVTVISWCTFGITVPGLLWFAAITLASVSDVTAIWNSNAFWAYLLSIKLQHLSWDLRRLASVVIASLGVCAVVYGSKSPPASPSDDIHLVSEISWTDRPRSPFLGNMLTLAASVGYGLYQVMYNMYAVPPESNPESNTWRRLSLSSVSEEDMSTDTTELVSSGETILPLPFGLYANMLTSGMGVMTLIILWIPLPILHVMSIELFDWPHDSWTLTVVIGIALSAVTFYMSFMILLGVWGPVVTSVGNLLTIVLVMISDIIFGNAMETLTIWSLMGSGMIVSAFAVLAYDSLKI